MGLRNEIEARGGGGDAGTSSRPSDNADEAAPAGARRAGGHCGMCLIPEYQNKKCF
jgi:hypothetical protein